MKNKIYEYLKMIVNYGSNGKIKSGDTLIVQLAEYDNDYNIKMQQNLFKKWE